MSRYKMYKPVGFEANITIENIDTGASIVIGTVGTIREFIGTSGLDIDKDVMSDEWDFEITEETAKTLVTKTAMGMNKPMRVKTQKDEQSNKKIDAMDVILGLATYN